MIVLKNSKYNIMKVGLFREIAADIRISIENGCKLKSRVPRTLPPESECVIYEYNNRSTLLRHGGPVIVFLPYKEAVNMLVSGDYKIAG